MELYFFNEYMTIPVVVFHNGVRIIYSLILYRVIHLFIYWKEASTISLALSTF